MSLETEPADMLTDAVYTVTSFEFGGCSDVRVHIVTDNMPMAEEVYNLVMQEANEYNDKYGNNATRLLVELSKLPWNTKLLGPEAATLFWGKHSILNNNK
jgi:hypothetical protein